MRAALPFAAAGPLGADNEPFLLAQEHHAAVSLRKETQQVVEQLAQERLQLQGAGQRLRDLQHHLQLVGRVLEVQRVVRGGGDDPAADDLVRLALEGGRLGSQASGRASRSGLNPLIEQSAILV